MWKRRNTNQTASLEQQAAVDQESDTSQPLSNHITDNLDQVRLQIGQSSDVIFRPFQITQLDIPVAVVYISGLADSKVIDEYILKPLMRKIPNQQETSFKSDIKRWILGETIPLGGTIEKNTMDALIREILTGSTILFIHGIGEALIFRTQSSHFRSIEEPNTEALVRGPRVGFIESLSMNLVLIRQALTDPNLVILNFELGTRSKKKASLLFIKDIASPELIEEVKKRIAEINLDFVVESGYIEGIIEDNRFSPFSQVQSTERPDRVVGALMEGRVSILLDGTPFALIVPVTLSMLLQSPEDYNIRWLPSTLIRLLRYLAAFASLFIPAIYISFVSFHPGLIPTKLAVAMSAARIGVPFPAFLEAFIMEVSIEILREAGLRLPKTIGQTVGLVGGLVIGQAAVQAGIVSPVMVIVVSLTAICSFAIPHYETGIGLRILRFVAMLFAACLGLYGVIMFFLFLSIHLVKLKSFGTLYTSPFVPYQVRDWKDAMLRLPLYTMKTRPKLLNTRNPFRKGPH